MPPRLTLFAAVFAASLCTLALAAPEPVQIPEVARHTLEMMQVDKVSSLTLLDEQGKQIDAPTFEKRFKEVGSFNMSKKVHGDAAPDVTLRLVTKEQLAASQVPATKLKVGDTFPEFHLTRLDGKPVDNKSLLGRYTLVSFYFAQCAPCVKEVPALNALAERRKDINVLALTFDSAADSKRFVQEHHLAWPIVPDAKKLLSDTIGLRGYPGIVLLDPQGKVIEFKVGGDPSGTDAVLNAWVNKIAVN
jgi:peroxiredoxin